MLNTGRAAIVRTVAARLFLIAEHERKAESETDGKAESETRRNYTRRTDGTGREPVGA